MKTYLLFIVTQFNLAVKAQDKSLSKHVVLISIDGFRPEFYLDEKWPAPILKVWQKRVLMHCSVFVCNQPFPYHHNYRCLSSNSWHLLQ
jgi:predicted AlkP superfamily pyrophosphatase or phosphodiesterase